MGGGASKNHSKDCASKKDSKDDQQFEAKDIEVKQDVEQSSRRRSPRAQPHVHFANNNEEGHVDSYSPRSHNKDEDNDYQDEDEVDCEDEEEDEEAAQLRMLFAQSAMSMDMDNEDLIFNLLYFGGDTSNFASMMNNAAEETVAAHSAGNTPYKLAPATELALKKLKVLIVDEKMINELKLQECTICQEEMEVGDEVAELPGCKHCFHNDCVLKWFGLQSWCPVCRTKILPDDNDEAEVDGEEEEAFSSTLSKGGVADDTTVLDVKSNLNAAFSEAVDEREEGVVF